VAGVVALAPAAESTTIVKAAGTAPFASYLGNILVAADGLHTGYGHSFDPAAFLTPAAVADLQRVSRECVDSTIARWRDRPISALLGRDLTTIAPTAAILEQNSAGAVNPGVPIFLGQGDQDQVIPLKVSAELRASYCRLEPTSSGMCIPARTTTGSSTPPRTTLSPGSATASLGIRSRAAAEKMPRGHKPIEPASWPRVDQTLCLGPDVSATAVDLQVSLAGIPVGRSNNVHVRCWLAPG
jgi:Secretory lipase